MATVEDIASLRLLIAEETEEVYSDVALSNRIDAALGVLDRVAYDIWVEKAARYAALADISEASSSRSLGSLHDKALKMAALFKSRLDAAEAVANPPASGIRISRLSR